MSCDPDLSQYSPKELLSRHVAIIDELKRRGVVRTRNLPIGDYTEWLVAGTLELTLAGNSAKGCDAVAADGTRFQIKGRRVTAENPSRQLSVIRNLDDNAFDYLIAVVFDAAFNVIEAVKMPHEAVAKYGRYRKHVNGYILHVQGELLQDPRVTAIQDIRHAERQFICVQRGQP